jgi:predicted ArsR family transcriptional regulator
LPTEAEVLQAIAEGATTTDELCRRFGITTVHAAVILSRYYQKGVVIRHGVAKNGKRGHPHIVYRLSKNGHKKLEKEALRQELAEIKAREREILEKLRE